MIAFLLVYCNEYTLSPFSRYDELFMKLRKTSNHFEQRFKHNKTSTC